jgi:hypothetical protein
MVKLALSTNNATVSLSNLRAGMPLRAPATAIKAHSVCNQVHQQPKQELGLWHFDGWS